MRKTFTILIIAFLSLPAFSQLPDYLPKDGLVGWWPFNGNANDESGNGINGTVLGAVLTNDRSGNMNCAYYFDGNNSSIDFASDLYLPYGSTDRAISFFFNAKAYKHGTRFISYGKWSVNQAFDVVYAWGSTTNSGKIDVVSHTQNLRTASEFQTNIWHHVIIVVSSNVLSVYVDGKLETKQSHTYDTQLNSGVWKIGSYCDMNREDKISFNGVIDDVGIWNRALTTQEITDLFNVDSNPTDVESIVNPDIKKIYPNPVADYLTLKIGNYGTERLSYYLYDLCGELIFNHKIVGTETRIPMQNMASGVYLLKVSKNNVDVEVFKIIKK